MQNIKSPIVVWAVLLFFGFPLVRELIVWLSTQFFGVNWDQSSTSLSTAPIVFNSVSVAILVVLYPSVRRLDHHILSQIWLYTIITGVIGAVYGLVVQPLLYSADMHGWTLGISNILLSIAGLIVLIWFARRVSAISFRHSLLFIGLVAAEQPGNFVPLHFLAGAPFVQPLSIYIAILVGKVLALGLAVWSLVNDQIIVSSTRSVLPPVTAMVMLAAAISGAYRIWGPVHGLDWMVPVMYGGIGSLISNALAVMITYAVRVRRPAEEAAQLC